MPTSGSAKSKKLSVIISVVISLFQGNIAWNASSNTRSADVYAGTDVRTKVVNSLYEKMECINDSDSSSKNMSSSTYSVLYDYLNGTGSHNFSESVTIGFLGAYRQAQVVLGALPLAVEAVNEDKGKPNISM